MEERMKSIKKLQSNHVLFGFENEDFWQMKLPAPVEEMSKSGLIRFINVKVKPSLKSGMVILNDNLKLD